MALGSTQPLNRNEYREYFLGVKAAGEQGWQPYHLHVPIVMKYGSLNLLEPSRPVMGLLYLYNTTTCPLWTSSSPLPAVS
jgi:hypothetical protein